MPTSTARLASAAPETPAPRRTGSTPARLERRVAGEEVVEGEHRVGLAAAEVGLQLDDRVAALAGEPPQGVERAGGAGPR